MEVQEFLSKHSALIDKQLAQFLSNELSNLKISDDMIKYLYSLISDYATIGGKRLRPLALVMSYLAKGGRDEKNILLPAIAIELHHAYSLILDDIMDEDEFRRGHPGINKRLREFFDNNFADKSSNGILFSKKSSRFVVSFAMMLGNITGILSRKAIHASNFSLEMKQKAIHILDNADLELYGGQMMDMLMELKDDVSENDYLEMIRLKTGILFGCAFELGGLFAEANDNALFLLRQFGINCAMSFQLQDDILDLESGKGHTLGSDIKKGKKTLLYLKSKQSATESQRKIIDELYGKEDINDVGIQRIISIMRDTGALGYCRKMAESKNKEAHAILTKLNLDIRYEELFFQFSRLMIERTI